MNRTITVSLKVPESRSHCAEWIVQQDPNVVAMVLESSETFHSIAASLLESSSKSNLHCVREELKTNITDLRALLQQRTEELSEARSMLIKLEGQKTAEMMKDVARTKKEIQEMYEKKLVEKESTIQGMLQERVDMKNKILQEERERVQQNKVAESRSCDLLVATLQGQVSGLQTQLEDARQLYKAERAESQSKIANKDEKISELHALNESILKECNDKVTGVVSSLTGSSSSIGDTGEGFVRRRMSTLNLGVFEDESSNPNAGYADGTWKYEYPSESGIPTIHCICEIKNEEELQSKDFDKFCKIDVPAAQLLGKNWGMFISLRRRICGKPSVSVDMKLGIPVMWISRDASDSLSAEKMIELAFHTVVDIWPIMQKTSLSTKDSDGVLRKVCEHLETQREEIERLNKMCNDLERCGQQIVKKSNGMRSIQESLLKGIMNLRCSDVRLVSSDSNDVYNFWETDGALLKKAISDYHTSHGRHVANLRDLKLGDDLVSLVEGIPHAFKTALDSVKSEIQKEASLKRAQKRKTSDK